MWFVFPQLRGLGGSEKAVLYGLADADEAQRYLEHPVLGPRLTEICTALLAVEGASARAVFGEPDDAKLRSCATLFARVSGEGSVFGGVLERFFGGEACGRTTRMLG